MKALRTGGRALLIALFLATATLGGGLLIVPLTLRPLTLLDRLLLRLALVDNGLGLQVTARRWSRGRKLSAIGRMCARAGHLGGQGGAQRSTTVWDDPIEGEHKNGKRYLLPCLESHAPIDLVALMLGTNGLKQHFRLSAAEIAAGAATLVDSILRSPCGPQNRAPKVLLSCAVGGTAQQLRLETDVHQALSHAVARVVRELLGA